MASNTPKKRSSDAATYRSENITPRGIHITSVRADRTSWPLIVETLEKRILERARVCAKKWIEEEASQKVLSGVPKRANKIAATAGRAKVELPKEGALEISLCPPIFKGFDLGQIETTFIAHNSKVSMRTEKTKRRAPDQFFGLRARSNGEMECPGALDKDLLRKLLKKCGLVSDPLVTGTSSLNFPFCIFEAKGFDGSKIEAHSQLCEEIARCLELLEHLAQQPSIKNPKAKEPEPENEPSPLYQDDEGGCGLPIFAISMLGTEWEVFICFRVVHNEQQSRNLYSIWKGDMEIPKKVYKLLAIIDEIRNYAEQTYLPRARRYLQRWEDFLEDGSPQTKLKKALQPVSTPPKINKFRASSVEHWDQEELERAKKLSLGELDDELTPTKINKSRESSVEDLDEEELEQLERAKKLSLGELDDESPSRSTRSRRLGKPHLDRSSGSSSKQRRVRSENDTVYRSEQVRTTVPLQTESDKAKLIPASETIGRLEEELVERFRAGPPSGSSASIAPKAGSRLKPIKVR